MKYFLLIGIFFIHHVSAQDNKLPYHDGALVYENVDTFSSKKERLFVVSKQWVVDQFANANYVLQNEDKDNAHLSGKFFIKSKFGNVRMDYTATFIVDCKDNKSRIRIYDFRYSIGDFYEMRNVDSVMALQIVRGKDINSIWKDLDDHAKELLIEYKSYLRKNLNDNF